MAAKDKEQSRAFIDKARELGVDESGKRFKDAFKKLIPAKKQPPAKRVPPDQPS